MKTTKLGAEIIREAMRFHAMGCTEVPKGSNRVKCANEFYTFSTLPQPNAWCAALVSDIVRNACRKLDIANKLPYTAGTADMRNGAARNGLLIDRNPAPGAVGYRTRTGGGHVFIVVDVLEDPQGRRIMRTIEGNVSDSVDERTYPTTTLSIESHEYIHAELMNGGSYNTANPHEELNAVPGQPKNPYTPEQPVQTAGSSATSASGVKGVLNWFGSLFSSSTENKVIDYGDNYGPAREIVTRNYFAKRKDYKF